MNYYLDLETGKAMMTTEDDRGAIDDFLEDFDVEADDGEIDAKFEKWLDDYDCPGWQMDNIRDAFLIEREFVARFIHVPKQESRDGYNDMADFTETVANHRLRELLFVALNGKGAFSRFRDVLQSYPEQRERYFEFSNQRTRERILEWLADEDIELES